MDERFKRACAWMHMHADPEDMILNPQCLENIHPELRIEKTSPCPAAAFLFSHKNLQNFRPAGHHTNI